MTKTIRDFSGTAVLLLIVVFAALLIACVPWQAFDYVFTVVFHGFLLSLFAFAFSALFFAIFSVLRITGKFVPPESDSPVRRVIDFFFHGADACRSFMNFLVTMYCLAVLTAGLALNPQAGVALLVCAIAAGSAEKRFRETPSAKFVPAAVIVVSMIVLASGLHAASPGAPVAPASLAVAAVYLFAGMRRTGDREILPVIRVSSPWRLVSSQRFRLVLLGILVAPVHMLWAPGLSAPGAVETVAQSSVAGPANEMIFTPDGTGIVALDKKQHAARLLDRETLEEKISIPMRENPRDIAYDPDKNLYYVVQHSLEAGQLVIIDADTFQRLDTATVPSGECSQINAVEVDRAHGRILIGCDSSGQIFYLDRDTLKPHSDILEPTKPNGKGIVRMWLDEQRDRVITMGCILGPYLNVIDLAEWTLSDVIFTGLLTWEYARDEKTGRLFISVPFRSMVTVFDEKTLEYRGRIRAGLGARALAIDEGGRRLFVGDQIAGTVRVFNIDTLEQLDTFYLPSPRYFLYDDEDDALVVSDISGVSRVKQVVK